MPKILPAILETTKQGFTDQLFRVSKIPGVDRVQVDFADGKFAPNTLLPVTDMDVLTPTIHFEAHLMVESPKDFLDYQICGFKTIIVHYEAYKSESDLQAAIDLIKQQGLELGICLKVETPVEVLSNFTEKVKHFSLLSVHPGYQGTEFLPQTYDRVKTLRKLAPNAIIEVDGGLNETNIKQTAEAGADYLVVGSALIKSQNINESYEWLNSRLTS